MSRRNLTDKKIARLRKLLKTSPTAGFDLIQWLKDHRYAQTTGEATRLIMDKRVRSGSHVIGIAQMEVAGAMGRPETISYVERYQPIRYKDELIVLDQT